MGDVKILRVCHVSTQKSSTPPSVNLPLTFFDVAHLAFPTPTTQRIFFYNLKRHCSTSTFLTSHLPNLTRSLSHTLDLFYPLTGRLLVPLHNPTPSISYTAGDHVDFTVAESSTDLRELTSNQPKNDAAFESLLPSLSGTEHPLLALRVTLFPHQGMALAVATLDAAVDGSTVTHFMRTWAAMCKSSSATLVEDPPLFDRSAIHDPNSLTSSFLSRLNDRTHVGSNGSNGSNHHAAVGLARATFHLGASQLEKLRGWVELPSCSDFTLAVAVTWVCAVKARGGPVGDGKEAVVFMAGGRSRMRPPVKQSYFGSCVYGCVVEMESSELVAEGGASKAAAAVWDKIRAIEDGLVEMELGNMLDDMFGIAERGEAVFLVVGSPKMRAYNVDFGWGRPSKCEVMWCSNGARRGMCMSLAEGGGDEGGGLEIGLALPERLMEGFVCNFHDALETWG